MIMPSTINAGYAALLLDVPNGFDLSSLCHRPDAVISLRMNMLNETLLRTLKPRSIVVQLFAPKFDVLDVLERLNGWNYRGRVIMLAPPLPKRDIVLHELRAHGAPLRIQLLVAPT
ncbi:MAG: hypothetical protein ACJASV_002107 [Pseudorhodobacter sp.]|jgi:hypothetical protein